MRIRDFMNSEFKQFSNQDNIRSIPSIVDGLKESQRKAVYGMFRNGNSEIKVSQLSGQTALVSSYHHGEASMAETIVGLAQDYPGSNNVNLFEPIGQFGSILSSVAAAHRYIFTKPSENLKKFFKQEDECILEYKEEDGQKIEPVTYLPIVPMWIVNGTVGIGTGHSTRILPRDPKKVLSLIKRIVDGVAVQQKTINDCLTPSFTGWKGEVRGESLGNGEFRYEIVGVLKKVNQTTIKITELPVGYGIDKYKSILVDLMDKGKIRDFDNNSTESGFDIEVSVPREVGKLDEDKLIQLFKLSTRVTENITLWNVDGVLTRYPNAYEPLMEFIQFRLGKYEARRLKHVEINSDELEKLKATKTFILTWNELDNPTKMADDQIKGKMIQAGVPERYLDSFMSMRISSLTMTKFKELEEKIKATEAKLKKLQASTAEDLYLEDLVD